MEDSCLHSAEYFGEQRDFWWNYDFLALMAQRWDLQSKENVLDVGCGIGHWGRVLSPFLSKTTTITGVDNEPEWIKKAQNLAPKSMQKFHFIEADANDLPFEDDTFDLVTCQTVLIHMADPQKTLAEWVRVLRPGGLLAVAEPNNAVGHLVRSSVDFFDSIDRQMAGIGFVVTCERGKWNLGEGHNSIGDLVPGFMAKVGLEGVRTFISDKAASFVPPYSSKEEQAFIAQGEDWTNREIGIWNRHDTERFFVAGGGRPEDFESGWQRSLEDRRRNKGSIEQLEYHSAGGGMVYLISGTKS